MRFTAAVRAICALELRSLLRDPRTVLISIVLPVLLLPVLLVAINFVEDRRVEREETRIYRVAPAGTEGALAREVLDRVVERSATARSDGEGAAGGGGESRFRLMELEGSVEEAIEAERVDVVLEGLTSEEWEAWIAEDTARTRPDEFEGVRVLRVVYRANRTASREGAQALRAELFEVRDERRDAIVRGAGFPVPLERVAPLDTANVAPAEVVSGARLGRILTVLLLALVVLGGSIVATDTLAGEKERGTLNTLLTSAASRTEIVSGKLLAVMAVGLAIALVQVLNLWIYLGLGVIEAAEAYAIAVSPALALTLFVLYLPMVALTAGVLLLTSAYAGSYKEAQLYLTPVLLGLLVPTLVPILPDVSLESAIVLVPIANLSVAARDLMIGDVSFAWLAAAWLVTTLAALWVSRRTVHALEDEELVTGEAPSAAVVGGDALFRRRIVRWFVVFWAVKILIDFNLPFEDIRAVALVSVGIVFLAFPLLVVRRFGLDPVEAFALRRPRPGVWLGVAIGVPAGLIVAQSVFHLMNFVIPVPTELLESFGESLLPEDIPLWQLVVLLSVLPGITEELTFRGVLLHGLRRRFGPVALALVVGLIFGFFHFQIFRIPSTAAIGVMLTAVTLMTGSIFPAIVWHTLNNALAIWLGGIGFEPPGEFGLWAPLGAAGLALAFWIIWMNRTPYPDVGPPPGNTGWDPDPDQSERASRASVLKSTQME